MANKSSVLAVPLASIASSALSSSYQAINTGGLPNPCFLLELISTSSTGVTVSYDGTNDHTYLPAGLTKQLNAQANSQPNNWIANFSKGTVVYVKGTAGTGNIYVAALYQPVLAGE